MKYLHKRSDREKSRAYLRGTISDTLMGKEIRPQFEQHKMIFVIGSLYTLPGMSYNLNDLIKNAKTKSLKIYGQIPIKSEIERAIDECIEQKLMIKENGLYKAIP